MNPKRVKTYLILLGTTIAWGIAGPVIKYTLGWLSPEVFLLYRFAIAAAFGVLTITLTRKLNLPKNPRLLLWTLIYAFLTSTVQLGILFFGFNLTTAVSATLISSTAPLFVSLAGVYFLREHLTKREKIGLAVAFFGTTITIVGPIAHNHTGAIQIGGNLLVFLSMIVGTCTAVIAKKLLRENLDALAITNLSFIVGFLTLGPIMILSGNFDKAVNQIVSAPLQIHLTVAFMAVISGTLAYYWWHKATKSIEIGEVGVFSYLQPIFATPLAILWLKEAITLPFVAGALIIFVGVFMAQYKKARSS